MTTTDRLELAAYLGDPAARAALQRSAWECDELPFGLWLCDLQTHGKEALARVGLEIVRLDQAAAPLADDTPEASRLAANTLSAVEAWIGDPRGAADTVHGALAALRAAAGEHYDTEDETGWSLAHLCELCLADDDEAAGDYAELLGNVCKDEAAARAQIAARVVPWARAPG